MVEVDVGSNERLLERARCGDRRALDELCRREWQPVYGIAYHALGNVADAQDLTQETFLRPSAVRALPIDDRWATLPKSVACWKTIALPASCAMRDKSGEWEAVTCNGIGLDQETLEFTWESCNDGVPLDEVTNEPGRSDLSVSVALWCVILSGTKWSRGISSVGAQPRLGPL